MKIGITGSHGVGKTTLVDALIQEGVFNPEIVFGSVGRRVPQHWSAKRKQRYFNYWYVYKHYTTKEFVAPRTIYDTWAYSKLTIHPDYHFWLMNWAVRHVWYDVVFYVPIEFPLENDGVRPLDPEYHQAHDRQLRLILDYHGVPYHTIRGNLYRRVEAVKEVLLGG